MKWGHWLIATGALACVSQQVSANDYLFKGDCTVADEFRSNLKITDLISRNSYTSVIMLNYGSDNCKRSSVLVTDLSNRRVLGNYSLKFDAARKEYRVSKSSGTCSDAEYWAGGSGSYTFEINKYSSGSNTCEISLRITAEITYDAGDVVKPSGYAIPLNSHSFVMTQPDQSESGNFVTPVSFTATGR